MKTINVWMASNGIRPICILSLTRAYAKKTPISRKAHSLARAELSLETVFRRQYSSVYHAIAAFFDADKADDGERTRCQQEIEQMHLLALYVSVPEKRSYWLFATDAISNRRQFARTLQDRGFVYWPNSVAGNKPVTIEHSYSVLVTLLLLYLTLDYPNQTRIMLSTASTRNSKQMHYPAPRASHFTHPFSCQQESITHDPLPHNYR